MPSQHAIAEWIRQRETDRGILLSVRSGVQMLDYILARHHFLRAAYSEPKRKWKGFLAIMTTNKIHHAVVTEEEGGYLVSILKEPTQNKESYIEILMNESHPMYKRIHEATSVLNVAGEMTTIEGIGESFNSGCFHLIITEEEHKALAENKA